MLINEVCKLTGLTKKAINYYSSLGLLSPHVFDNGYRNYSEEDIRILRRISILRKLDLSTDEIRNILEDKTNETLQKVSLKKELVYQRNEQKNRILKKLCSGSSYDDVSDELKSIEQSEMISNRLLDAFPGYYGRFVCLHFARFLNETIQTEEQQAAYDTIVAFLDQLPDFKLPKELEEYLNEYSGNLGMEEILKTEKTNEAAYRNPEQFLNESKEVLQAYLNYRRSDDYKNSPAAKLKTLMDEFNSSSGYYDVFIPAMKQLSPSYAEYYAVMEQANETLLELYPDIQNLTD